MQKFYKLLLAVLAVLSYKNLPFAYVLKFYGGAFQHLVSQRGKYLKNGRKNTFGITTESKGPLAIFEPVSYGSYVSPMEYDMFMHKSNSTYFADLDMARLKMMCYVFQKALFSYMLNEHKDFKKASVFNTPFIPVARVECTFKKELKLFETYDIVSKVGAWDDKWLYVISKFVKRKDKRIVAIGITKYVFKLGRVTIPPEVMVDRSGLLTEEAKLKNAEYLELFKHYASTEQYEELCAHF